MTKGRLKDQLLASVLIAMGCGVLVLVGTGLITGELRVKAGLIQFEQSPLMFIAIAAIYTFGSLTLLVLGVISWRDAPRSEYALERHLSARRAIDVSVRRSLDDGTKDRPSER